MRVNQLILSLAAVCTFTACSNGTDFGIAPVENNFGSSALYNNKIDIIWLVDDSGSMLQHQTKLSKQMLTLATQLNSLKMDYRMVVTTTSVGTGFSGGKYMGTPAILSPNTPDLGNLLSARILVGNKGSQLERGILSLQNLLSDSYINGAGSGFHREDSLLLINVLSDANDDTEGSAASVVQSLISRLDALKRPYRPNVGGWLVNFIGVRNSSECPNGFGTDETGYRYLELVNESQGKAFAICEDSLKSAVEGLQARLLEIITDYPLSDIPDLATVKVYKNGVLVPQSSVSGWSYIPEINVIRFHGTAVPSADSSIKVSFTPASAS